MLTHSHFNNQGGIGNMLFKYASCLGLAKKYGVELQLPYWKYADYFEADFPQGSVPNCVSVKDPAFHYIPDFFDSLNWNSNISIGDNSGLYGCLQSEKYFDNCKELVRSQLKFNQAFAEDCRKSFEQVFEKPVIAIHIRRGDYINHKYYHNLPINYYILSLETHFSDWRDCNLLFFSDEIEYAKLHFGCLKNAYFSSDYTDIADLCLMSQCDHFILANSTFSWWGCWLGEKSHTKVVRPVQYFEGKLKQQHNTRDFYPERWTSFNYEGKKIDIKDLTVTVPVFYDHPDRQENLELCLAYLITQFDVSILIGEQGARRFQYLSDYCHYMHFEGMEVFHRTKMLNDMARASNTPFVANYDCDVFFAPMAILETVHRLRNGCDVVSPFSGAFAGVPRQTWLNRLQSSLDVGIFGKTKFNGRGIDPNAQDAVGGAIFVKKESFWKVGGENERFVSYGPEDAERFHRFQKLGLRVERVEGYLYHIEHWRGADSGNQHRYFQANEKEWQRVKAMSKTELEKYIESWNWIER